MTRFNSIREATHALNMCFNGTSYDIADTETLVTDIWNSAQENKSPPTVDLNYIRGSKIQSIKVLRQLTGLGLKDTKDLAEAIQEACNNSDNVNSPVDQRISNLEWDVQFAKGLITNRDETISQQEKTIKHLRALLHSLIDRV